VYVLLFAVAKWQNCCNHLSYSVEQQLCGLLHCGSSNLTRKVVCCAMSANVFGSEPLSPVRAEK
jgi:hypothetical protein